MLLWIMDVGYEKKTIFHSFREVFIEFVLCKWDWFVNAGNE